MITYEIMQQQHIKFNALDTFNRTQHTQRIKYVMYHDDLTLKSNEVYEKEDQFTDEWTLEQKRWICQYLKHHDGIVIFAYDADQVIGFCNIDHQVINGYVLMPYIHVSKPYRHQGIATQMFHMICSEAKKIKGAEKLYISAHPNVDTYQFYMHVGCRLATQIIKEQYDKEPRDLQLEKDLYE